jgi:hypothetical protein
MKKLLLATIASVLVAAVGIYLLLNQTSKGHPKQVVQGPGFTLFQGVGSSGPPDAKPIVESTMPKSVPVLGHHQFGSYSGSFDLDGLTAVQYVDKHRAKARSDPQLAYHLYEAEALCAVDLPLVKARAANPNDTNNNAERVKDIIAVCDGMTPAMMGERQQFLLQAAQAGIKGAAISYLFDRPSDPTQNNPLPDDWKANAVAFLKMAGAQGDANALYYLGSSYEIGKIVPKDPEKALTYVVASFEINSPIDPGNTAVKRLSQGLTPDQIATAIQQGKAMAAQAKARSS